MGENSPYVRAETSTPISLRPKFSIEQLLMKVGFTRVGRAIVVVGTERGKEWRIEESTEYRG